VLGKEHRNTLASANSLAEAYKAQGRYDEAEPLFKRTLEGVVRVFGKEHPNTLIIADNLAGLYRLQGRYGKAEPLAKASRTNNIAIYGGVSGVIV
jgi:tetratricopeptide (TPR) repeat protein